MRNPEGCSPQRRVNALHPHAPRRWTSYDCFPFRIGVGRVGPAFFFGDQLPVEIPEPFSSLFFMCW